MYLREKDTMKQDIIDFLESKGYFSIYGLIIIILEEIGDWLEYNPKWSFIKLLTFLGYYYLFFFIWMVADVAVKQIKK